MADYRSAVWHQHPEAIAHVERFYATRSAGRLAREIEAMTGRRVTAMAVQNKAAAVGARCHEHPEGWLGIGELCDLVGRSWHMVSSLIKRNGWPLTRRPGGRRVTWVHPITAARVKLHYGQALTVRELCAYVGGAPVNYENRIARGAIASVRVDGMVCVPVAEVQRLKAARMGPRPPAVTRERKQAPSCPSCGVGCTSKGVRHLSTLGISVRVLRCVRGCGASHRRRLSDGAIVPPVDRALVRRFHPWARQAVQP